MDVLESIPVLQKTEFRQTLFEELYETAFPAVAHFVSKMGGSFDDARDVFQDALIVLHEKQGEDEFALNTSAKAYLLGIAKHLWIRKFNTGRPEIALDETEAAISIPEHFYPAVNEQRLLRIIENTGKQCLNLLRAFYYDKLPVKQIANALGYGSEHSASVQKYKCIEKIRTTLKQQSISYEDFID
jgi:RNA polymerase sigma factor (sigma-70 family)